MTPEKQTPAPKFGVMLTLGQSLLSFDCQAIGCCLHVEYPTSIKVHAGKPKGLRASRDRMFAYKCNFSAASSHLLSVQPQIWTAFLPNIIHPLSEI